MRRATRLLLTVVTALLLLGLAAFFVDRVWFEPEDHRVQARLDRGSPISGGQQDLKGFARAEGPKPFNFPADHGPHPDFQTEWWYYTGNLNTVDGRRFGYQLTFFRRALAPAGEFTRRESSWGTEQVFMAHFALTDVEARDYQAFERLARDAVGLAGAQSAPYRVWLENWSSKETQPGEYRLMASQDGLAIDLILNDRKGPIPQGDQGFSPKGPEQGNASYYYSLTRLETSGTVRVESDVYPVTGLSWMDHEYSTSALSKGQIGWDWFSIQFDDNSELMIFQLRREDGSIDLFSSGTMVAPDGSTITLAKEDFNIEVEDTWSSPRSKARYPSRWKVSIPTLGISLDIRPSLADQELDVSYSYWEGAVLVSGQRDGRPLSGSGYVELTGYALSMAGEF